ncbi:hypothetical protein GGX14DRAFT_558755 [Mycena pura]|uniref:Uncharacterized protein n=1 Tax=Mycena pura TaxID=153505 RepID=A0AAD6VUR6_9AGAR|nr:hypothetical protein GGX14DRAFT_558755 [Mycena pura]
MAPPGWMTPAQHAVVPPFFPDYSKYQASKKLYKFWPLVYEAWFHAFPEEAQLGIDKATATVEELDALRRATEKRKGQLQIWFRNQRAKTARAAGHTTTLSNTTLTSALFTGKSKRSRIHKPIEAWYLIQDLI